MGQTIRMGAQYRDTEGNWHDANNSITHCKFLGIKDCECGRGGFYCPYDKEYPFFRTLVDIKGTTCEYVYGHYYGSDESDKYFVISLKDLKEFDWEQEVIVRTSYDRSYKKPGTYKASEVCEDFLNFTMKELEKLAEIHDEDNIRIVYQISC